MVQTTTGGISMSEEVTDTNFAKQVLNADVPVLVDFWAPWCGPCRTMSPIIDQISAETGDRFRIVKINVDSSPSIAKKYEISSIPSLYVFEDGEVVKKLQGAHPKATIVQLLEDPTGR
jgi:thioredoxin 1